MVSPNPQRVRVEANVPRGRSPAVAAAAAAAYLHGEHPAGGLPERVPHGHLQALQVVVLDDEGQHGPLEVPLPLAEGAVRRDEPGQLRGRVAQQGRAHLWRGSTGQTELNIGRVNHWLGGSG